MIATHLSLERFMSYDRKCSISFSGKPIVGILGCNEIGKSSLLQAISYGIHGETRARREDQLITSGSTGPMSVELQLHFPDGSTLEITRGREQNGDPILKLAGYTGKPSELAQILRDKVRLQYTDFQALTYFQQGDIHQFMQGNKREFFNRWTSGLRFWSDCEKEAKYHAEHHSSEAREANLRLQSADKTLALSVDILDSLEQSKDVVRITEERLTEKSIKLAEAESYVTAIETTEDLNREFLFLVSSLEEMKQRGLVIKKQLDNLQKEAEKIGSGNCPILDCYCDFLAHSEDTARESLSDTNNILVQEHQELRERYKTTRNRHKKVQSQLREYTQNDGREELQLAQKEKQEAEKQFRLASRQQARCIVDAEQLITSEDAAKQARADIDSASVELSRWVFIQKMCGKSGIPSLIIEQELTRVESRCNWVLDRLGYRKRMKFSGYRELKGWEKECLRCGHKKWHSQTCLRCGSARQRRRKDELTVTVLDGIHERPFELESGGAQVLQSFAVRLACSLFLSTLTGVPMRMVMLDEVFAMLDSANRQHLMSLVINKLSREFGLEQQLVVSHHEDVLAAVNDVLVISKERGSSVARWG